MPAGSCPPNWGGSSIGDGPYLRRGEPRRAGRAAARLAAVFVAFLLSPLPSSQTLSTIAIDGNTSDWSAVLSDPDNASPDAARGAGDPDVPAQLSSDLRQFAYTWDATNLYFYFARGTTSQAGISVVVYIDLDHDLYLEASDRLVFFNFNNSGFQSGILYAYVPTGAGNVLCGDGCNMPGGVGATISTALTGAQSNPAVEYECALPWSALGVAAGTPVYLKPSLALGTNLPSQLEDNGAVLNTLVPGVSVTPDRSGSATASSVKSYSHTVQNTGNGPDTIDLSAVSSQGFAVLFYDGPGSTPLADTDSDGIVDTGPLAAGATLAITVKITVPASTVSGTVDATTIKGTSSQDTSKTSTATDTTSVGDVVLYPSRAKNAEAGVNVDYSSTLVNDTSSSVSMTIASSSSLSWGTAVYLDATCEGTPDGPPISSYVIAPSASVCLITRVTVPGGATLGQQDITTTSVTYSNPPVTSSVTGTTTVSDPVSIVPSNSASAGAGYLVTYSHTVANNRIAVDTLNVTTASTQSWTRTLYKADGVTLLPDTNADAIPDTGSLPANGGSAGIKVKISVPSGATYNTTDTTTVTATSAATGVFRSASDGTTVKVVVTFQNSSYSIPQQKFKPCSAVYVRGFGLSNGTYRFRFFDPSGSPKTASPAELSPNLNGQVSDSYTLSGNDPVGAAWYVYLEQKSGQNWSLVANGTAFFDVVSGGSVTLATGKPTYDQTGETVAVTGTLTNTDTIASSQTIVEYVIFRDANGNGAPDVGESMIESDGTSSSYDGILRTHTTAGLDVAASSSTSDGWSVANVQFSAPGTWKVYAAWRNPCTTTPIATSALAFQVVFDSVPPTSVIGSPAGGSTVYISASPISITGTATDSGTWVTAVDASVDGGSTWAAATSTGVNYSTWSFAWTPQTRGSHTLKSRATDAASNVETSGVGVTVTVVDDTPPSTPVVTDDGSYTASSSALHAIWSSFDLQSGIGKYEYAIGTSPGATNVVGWTDVALSTDVIRSGLSLSNGVAYYWNVRATNIDGYVSSVGSSNGIVADLTAPSASITAPTAGQVLQGATYTVQGTATDALSGVQKVQVSTNGGSTWQDATGTTSWSYVWTLPADGSYTILARATDNVGNVQGAPASVSVTVDNPPAPVTGLGASYVGFCQVKLDWNPSASPDINRYYVYSDQGSGAINYGTPVATVMHPATTFTTARGIYGYCPVAVSLPSPYNVASYTLVNANKSSYTISSITVNWTGPEDGKFVKEIKLGGATVFSTPSGSPSNRGLALAVTPTPVAAGATMTVETTFEYQAGGNPDMRGITYSATYAGSGSSPTVGALLQPSGQYPSPCQDGNATSVEPGVAYKFGVRARDAAGNVETNTSVVVTATACSSSSLQAAVKFPDPGRRIDGSRVTVYAELLSGDYADLQDVRFQYSTDGGGSWTDMTAATAPHQNPNAGRPYFIHWDVTGLPSGNTVLRAVAKDQLGSTDASPSTITIVVDHTASRTHYEYVNGDGKIQTEMAVAAATPSLLVTGDDTDDNVTKVTLPAGALGSGTTLTLVINPLGTPAIVSPFTGVNESRLVTLASGSLLAEATLEIPYNDANQDGTVDGTTVKEWEVEGYRHDGSAWQRLPSSSVDIQGNTVRGQTASFSYFALLRKDLALGDSVRPKAVTGLLAPRLSASTIRFSWTAVTQDVNGDPESVRLYDVYRGVTPSFVADRAGKSNLIGVATSTTFDDVQSLGTSANYYYRVTAIDDAGNESDP